MTNIERFKAIITNANHVVITTHLHPDADGIGSQVALCLALKHLEINCFCVNEEPLMERYRYLDPTRKIISRQEYISECNDDKIDLLIVVDTNSTTRIGPKMEKLSEKAGKILFIDHHPCNQDIKGEHCIDTTRAATGELIGAIIESLGVEYTPDIALPLYTAILIDTSSFRYPTVTHLTHRMIAKLMETGVRPPFAFNKINGTKRLEHMQLLGHVLSNTQMLCDGKIAWLTIPEALINKFEIDPEDTHSYVNHLLILDNLEIACMFRETGENIKISFRSGGDIDVGIIAGQLGGGGHNHSAATIVKGKLDQVVKDTVEALKKYINHYC